MPLLVSMPLYCDSSVMEENCVSGCMPNITRNAIVNCAELVTYDIIKELILKYDLMTGTRHTHNLNHTLQGRCPPEASISF